MKPIHSPLREKSFFRKVSNELLRRFLNHHDVLNEIEWDGRDEASVTDIYDAYANLAADVREPVTADLENLNDLASQRGMPCLVDAAGVHDASHSRRPEHETIPVCPAGGLQILSHTSSNVVSNRLLFLTLHLPSLFFPFSLQLLSEQRFFL